VERIKKKVKWFHGRSVSEEPSLFSAPHSGIISLGLINSTFHLPVASVLLSAI
jgi:hypothetical protein